MQRLPYLERKLYGNVSGCLACNEKAKWACQVRSNHVLISKMACFHPAGATGIPLHWALHTDKRAVCLRFAPEDRSDLSAPWSHSVQVGQAGKADQHVAIPVTVPGKDQQGEADLKLPQLES